MKKRDASRLRREAERETAGAPERAYFKANDGSLRLHPRSTRGLYQRLKRKARG